MTVTREEFLAKERERNAQRRASFGRFICSSHKAPRPCEECKAYQKAYRESGRKKKYAYKPDGRMTFCEKCVSEKPVNGQCEPCRASYGRNYRERNADRRRAYKAAFWLANKERLSADNKARYWANSESRKAHNRRYHRENTEACNIRQGRRRARLMECAGSHTVAEWQAVLAAHRHRCADCGTKENLTKDHIVPLSQGGSDFAFNLQPLCLSCNSAKRDRIAKGTQHSLFDRVSP